MLGDASPKAFLLLSQNGVKCELSWKLSGAITNGILTASISVGGNIDTAVSATVAPDGKSVSGSFSGGSLCGFISSGATGAFTGTLVLPINGTFSGTLSGTGQQCQVTLQIAEDSNFDITASGIVISAGTVTNI